MLFIKKKPSSGGGLQGISIMLEKLLTIEPNSQTTFID
jgi:hypothetical protein